MSAQRSIVIGGGALAGLALALALRQGLGADIPIIVADPALGLRPSRDPRATAIVAACRRLFDAIGVWDQVAGQAQPILDMVVTDSKLEDATRPVFLTFAGHVEPGEPFAHMVENRHLIDVLVARAEAEGIELRATAVASFDSRNQGIDVTLADGSVIAASLLVAADGARSKLRERAGIATHGWDYDQSGIVVTVGHERDHHGRAEEHFLPAGPFAILPLTGQRSSLVWTEKRGAAARVSTRLFRGALVHRRTDGADRRRRACDSPDRRPRSQHGPEGRRCTRRSGRRCGAARDGSRAGRCARPLSALATLRHHGDGARHQFAESAVLEQIDAFTHGARYWARAGRSRAAADKPVHPSGGGACRRGAAAVEGRGAVAIISVLPACAGTTTAKINGRRSQERNSRPNRSGQCRARAQVGYRRPHHPLHLQHRPERDSCPEAKAR